MNENYLPDVTFHSIDETSDSLESQLNTAFCQLFMQPDTLSKRVTVLLKPDMTDSDLPLHIGCTSVRLLRVVCEYLTKRGADVLIADSPSVDGAPVSLRWEQLGLDELDTISGVTLVDLEKTGTVARTVESRLYYLSEVVSRADYIINIPKLKPSGRFGIAGALRNLFGLLPGYQKQKYLSMSTSMAKVAEAATDLYFLIQPDLTIVDALAEEEIGTGKCRTHGSVIVSSDGLALDNILYRILNIPSKYLIIPQTALNSGLGLSETNLIGYDESVEHDLKSYFLTDFQPISALQSHIEARIYQWSSPSLTLLRNKCDACNECVSLCPTRSIKSASISALPQIRSSSCIRCYRCSRNCPRNALQISNPPLRKLLSTLGRTFCAS